MKNVIRYSFILASLLVVSQAIAADTSNELVKMDLNQTNDGAVKVNIYTDKPYNEQIIVNKKPDNKYVILLPETSNNMNIKPDISGVSDVKNVDVKSQQYSSGVGKGYTKIIIDSKKPIDVVPQAHVTKTLPTYNRSNTSSYSRQVQVPQRVLNPQRPVTNNDFVPAYERQRQLNQQQNNYVATPQRTVVRRETPIQQVQRQVQQYIQPQQQIVQQPVTNVTDQQTVTTTTNTSALTPTEQTLLTENAQNNQTVEDKDKTQASAVDDDISESDLAFFKKIIRFKQKVVRKIKKLLSVKITFASFMTVLQLILLIVLVKVIADLGKKFNGQNETPRSVTRRLIHNNDEAFEQSYPSYSNMDMYNNTASDNFTEDTKEGFNVPTFSTPMSYNRQKSQNNLYSNAQSYGQPKSYSGSTVSANDFYKPMSEVDEEDKMSIFDENERDIEKTIFKNPLTQISKQDEETLFDEPMTENSPFSEESYEIRESDDFFNYGQPQNKDEDFFIFEDEEDEENIAYQEDYIDEENDENTEYVYVDEDGNEIDANDDEYEYVEEVEEYDDVEEPEQVQQPQQDYNPFEHLSVKSKYVIDANRGFAQVNVDGLNALIGYVGSKISVIRKFKEDVNGTMQVRLNEQPDAETMIYIVKVGSMKTLVEVKQDSIRQLLDL